MHPCVAAACAAFFGLSHHAHASGGSALNPVRPSGLDILQIGDVPGTHGVPCPTAPSKIQFDGIVNVYADIFKIGSVIVTFFVPVAAPAPELEAAPEGTAADVPSIASSGGAFDPHAVPTLAATIATAIALVNNFDFKAHLDFMPELNFIVFFHPSTKYFPKRVKRRKYYFAASVAGSHNVALFTTVATKSSTIVFIPAAFKS